MDDRRSTEDSLPAPRTRRLNRRQVLGPALLATSAGVAGAGLGAEPANAEPAGLRAADPSPFVPEYGAVGDGTTDDTTAFERFEADWQDYDVDLEKKTCLVTAIPNGNRYYNGTWRLRSADGTETDYETIWRGKTHHSGLGRIAFGTGALGALPPSYFPSDDSTVVALGYQALGASDGVQRSVAIGGQAMGTTKKSLDNIGIGYNALYNVQSVKDDYDQDEQRGTRNVAMGGNAGMFVSDGFGVVAIGRNSMSGLTSGQGGVAVGQNAVGGFAPVGLSGEIENWAAWGEYGSMNRTVGVGTSALHRTQNTSAVGIGGEALGNLKKSPNNTAVGARALFALEQDAGPSGGAWTPLDIDGTYTHSGNTLTLRFPGHGVSVGEVAQFRLLNGPSQTFENDQVRAFVTEVVDAETFRVEHPIAREGEGDASLYGRELVDPPIDTNSNNTAIGTSAASALIASADSVFVGEMSAGTATAADRSVIVGRRALQSARSTTDDVVIGHNAAPSATGDSHDLIVIGSGADADANGATVIGRQASVSGDNGVAIGPGAVAGTDSIALGSKAMTGPYRNAVAIGRGAVAGGDGQLRLGNGEQTVWCRNGVVNASDVRDKADVRESVLGLDFVNRLRPVDFRYDHRADYDGEKDGSKKRRRFHHGLLAQDVKRVMDETGVDFGGYVDQTVAGGADELALGYTEFIAPLIKAVQELSKRNIELEQRLARLEQRNVRD